MLKKTTIIVSVFLLGITILFSCRKNLKNPSWDADLLLPLVNSSLSINNLIKSTLIHSNPDNSLDLVYKSSLYSFSLDTLFKIRDTTLKNIYSLWVPIIINPGGIVLPQTTNTIKYDLRDVQLSTATLRQGQMQLFIRSQIREKTILYYQIPSAISPIGKPFSVRVMLPAKTALSDGYYNQTFDMTGYQLNLTGPKGDKVNTVVTSFYAFVDSLAPDTVLIHAGNSVVISNKFINFSPSYARGYFGNSVTTAGPDTAKLALFNSIIGGNLKFDKVNVRLAIENNIGADIRLNISALSSYNTRTKSNVKLTGNTISSPINLSRSLDNGGTVIPSTYTVSFNSINSNINEFVGNLPDRIISKLNFEFNPLGNVSGGNDFIYYDKLLKASLSMTVPLSLLANDFTVVDTVDFELNPISKNINSGYLYLYADNGFPFTASAQLYVMSASYVIADSLFFTPNTILAPPLDKNYIAIGTMRSKLAIPLNKDKIETLKNATHLYIKIRFNTAGQPNYVKIYDYYGIKVRVVGDFNYTLSKN